MGYLLPGDYPGNFFHTEGFPGIVYTLLNDPRRNQEGNRNIVGKAFLTQSTPSFSSESPRIFFNSSLGDLGVKESATLQPELLNAMDVLHHDKA
jgi:hypothetical protein